MGTEQTAAAAASADRGTGDSGLTLAGLIDVLDRADEALGPRRSRPRRAALHRSPGVRTGAEGRDLLHGTAPHTARPGAPRATSRSAPARPMPLRSVRPSPPARSGAAVPAGSVRPAPAPEWPRRLLGLLRALARRAALWGAGTDGEHLAWGGSTTVPASVPEASRPIGPRVARSRRHDPPVVLRELPSTPTWRPAAPSPAAAPGAGAARAERWVRPGSAGRLPASVRASGGPVPSRARSPGGVVGSPGTAPARGSPPWWPEPG